MKKSFFIIILITGIITNTFAQDTIRLSFSAQYNQEHLSLDSILIMNLTQGENTVLFAPDTILELIFDTIGVNIHDLHGANSFSVSQNYPNPFIEQTFIDVGIIKRDDVQIRIFDLSGREHASYTGILDAGIHTFTFYPGRASFYIFSVWYGGLTRNIKMANPLSGNQKCKLRYSGFEEREETLKSQRDFNFPYDWGDNLRYIGYALTPDGGFLGIPGSDFIDDTPDNNESYIFDISLGIPCVNIPTVEYGGVIYNTVQIGTQCWLKENLRIGTMVPGLQEQTDNDTIEKYCQGDNLDTCEKFGGLYQWGEAMKYSWEPGVRGICPPGWHIPTDEEFKQLEGAVDTQYGYPDPVWDSAGYRGYDVGTRLRSRQTWETTRGTNNVGFTALGTGSRFIDGTFWTLHRYTSFWTSNYYTGTIILYRYTEDWKEGVCRTSAPHNMGRAVRCLRNQ